ncbi:MAG: family 10 glycosylhydrolase [Phycisphaerae bacterium]|nr:family 10 glycosylhydrolase [Phycisphaerae bacterium]
MKPSSTSVGCRFALIVLAAICVIADSNTPAAADEYRAFWVDAWGSGFLNQGEVETLLGQVGNPGSGGRIRDANCNMVVVQVRRRADVCYPSGMGEPYMGGLTPSNFNALQAMIDAAHDTTGGKKRIEVHCWLVAFKTAHGLVYDQHSDPGDPDNYWPTRLESGSENSDGAFDPGHPMFLEYLTDVCMDLVNNFDIDGIHYDYIRFEANTEGYNPTSVARYNERYGLTGQPSSTSAQFKQWRRDQVSSVVRKVYANVQKSKPWVKQSGSFVTWNPSPASSTRSAFMATRPYYDVYSDWDAWMEEGLMDMGIPMTYYNWASLPTDYTRWMNFEKDRKFNRHMIVGPGIYLNSLSNAISEILMTRNASPAGNYADGFCGYSYRAPYSGGGTWTGFAPSLLSQVTPTWDDIPDMPWKSAPTLGHIMGTVTHADSSWADHATVSITGPASRSMYVDGTGSYAFIDLPTGLYTITASKAGHPNAVATANVQIGVVTGNMYERDLILGGDAPPAISGVQASGVTNNAATITWTTNTEADSQVQYGLTTAYGSTTPLDPTEVTSHSVGLSGLSANTLYHYRVISSNAYGTTTSGDYTFTTSGPPAISNVQSGNITADGATITWTTNTAANSQVRYGLTAGYGSQTPVDPANVTSHSVTLSGLSPNTLYHYQAVSVNAYGSAQSADFVFTTAGPPIISNVLAASVGGTHATITWTTSTPADSQVEYGLTIAYGSSSTLDPAAVTSHSIALSGLLPNTLYHYRARSANAAGTAYSGDNTFTTTADVADIVIDNLDPGWANTSPSGSWSSGSVAEVPKIGTNYLYCGATGSTSESSITTSCTWTPDIQAAGYYDVYVFYQIGANRNPAAPFKVFYDGGSVTSIENQYSSTPNLGGWFLVGADLPFQLGTAGYVQCANNSADTRYVSADAAKFVYKTAMATPPTITAHPTAQAVCEGDTAVFTVTATGEGTLSYQWQKNGVDLTNDGTYSGVFTATCTVTDVDGDEADADYRCVVTNSAGSTNSNAAALSLKAPTVITLQPQSQAVDAGGTATFIVAATGEGELSYQWQKNGVDLNEGGHYSGVFTLELTVTDVDGDHAADYRCVVAADCGTAESDAATLTVNQYASGDIDGDGDVDLTDFGTFSGCFNGPNRAPVYPSCDVVDFDGDNDVDLTDFGVFSACFNGPNRAPACP